MKNHLAGFIISALLHLGGVGLLINLDISKAEKTPEPDQIPLTLAMFQSEPVKPAPVAETLPKEAKPEPVIEPVVEPIVVEKTPIEPELEPVIEPKEELIIVEKTTIEAEPVKKAEPEPVVKPLPIIKKEPEVIVKPVKPKKKIKPKLVKRKITKPKPGKKKKKVVKKKKKQPKVVRKPIAKKVKPKVVKKKKAVTQVRKIVRKAPVRKAKAIQRTTRPTPARAIKVPTKPRVQTTRPAVNGAQAARVESAYKARLRKLIAANKRYPKRAKRRRQQGTVRVSFIVYANGMIKNIRAVTSSGHSTLDKAAISAIQKISGKLPFPAGLKRTQWVLTIPVAYKLR